MSDLGSAIYHKLADRFPTALNMLKPSHPNNAPAVHFTLPPSHFFQFPPSQEPLSLNPPISDRTLARPFSIDPDLYNNALHVAVPISVALVYAALVTVFNRVNKRREHKPWAISKSVVFYAFVLTHNIFLALYSAWTCLGMLNAYRQSWPGLNSRYGLVGAVDALCKIHGPRGLGSAATYDPNTSSWGVTDRLVQLLQGSPDSTDVGRIWNEGLAFYGWLFYVSKFYEITDTFIILAKGKKSSILQTYHHAGAMMCMWAGIRYMSPPIWMFVFINSGLHAAMYTYYALGTLALPVPRILKQTLTSLQIAQFIFGASYAIAHLFIAYSIPVSTPYLYIHNLSTAVPAMASSASSILSTATATATAGLGSWLKKAALRAAGEEGLAENVRNDRGEPFGIDAVHAAQVEEAQKEIRYRVQYQTVQCLDTSGQAFAILLNALYLAPLTWLFINFFIQSYLGRVRSASPPPDRKKIAQESSKDAVHNLEKELKKAMAEKEEGSQADPPPAVQEKFDHARTNIKNKADDLSSKTKKSVQDTNDAVSRTAKNVKSEAEKGAKNAADAITGQVKNAKALALDAKDAVEQVAKDAQEALAKRSKDAQEQVDQEVYKKRPNEAAEADEERRNDGRAGDQQDEDSIIESEERGDRPTDGDKTDNTDDTVESKQDTADPGHASADQAPRPENNEQERSAESKPNAKTDTKADPKAEKLDEEWDPEDGHDAEAEEYEVKIDAMLNASEKRAEKELLPDNLS